MTIKCTGTAQNGGKQPTGEHFLDSGISPTLYIITRTPYFRSPLIVLQHWLLYTVLDIWLYLSNDLNFRRELLTGYIEAEFALAADLCGLCDLPLACDTLHDVGRALSAHLHGERTAGHVLVRVLHVDDVGAGLRRPVAHQTGAVLVVVALNVRLAGTLDRQAQTTET